MHYSNFFNIQYVIKIYAKIFLVTVLVLMLKSDIKGVFEITLKVITVDNSYRKNEKTNCFIQKIFIVFKIHAVENFLPCIYFHYFWFYVSKKLVVFRVCFFLVFVNKE